MAKVEMTFAELTDEWMTISCVNLAKSTVYGYTMYNKLYFLPEIGQCLLSDILQKDIQRIINKMAKKGLSHKTQKNAIGQLHKMFQYAVINGYKDCNPVNQIVMKKTPPHEYVIYSREQFKQLMSVCNKQKDKAALALAGYAGLRESEIFGLKWENVELTNRRVHIFHVAVSIGCSGLEIKDIPKTTSGNRWIELSSEVIRELLLWQKESGRQHGYIFPSLRNPDMPDPPGNFRKRVYRYMKAAELEHARIHDMRHYAASEFMDSGAPDKYIAAYLGHADTNMTRYYQHIRTTTIPYPIRPKKEDEKE